MNGHGMAPTDAVAAGAWASGGSLRGTGVALSIYRTFAPDPLPISEPCGREGRTQLWWGPLVEVKPGDRIRYFATPMGVAVEEVVPA